MTLSHTRSEAWTRTDAREVGGQVVADLRQMQQEYGFPTYHRLEQYLAELVILLADGLLHEVTYGFRRSGAWIAAIRYVADMNGNLSVNDRSGRVPRGVNVSGATWGSYLTKSEKWKQLSPGGRAAVQNELPFERQGADELTDGASIRVCDKTYSSAGCGVRRSTIGGVW